MTAVLVVGATGALGSKIVGSLRRRGARIRALVRPGTSHTDVVKTLADGGVEIVEGNILDAVDGLARTVEGVDVVISAVQGGEDVVTHG
jgi:uncharacterized protein YbjT (DUF2867 family)